MTKNSETILQMAILGEKQKTFFFFENFIKMLNTLRPFDFWSKDLMGHKLSFSNKYPFFLPFLTKNSETILQRAILREKQKNFFFWKLYQYAKTPVAFDFWSKNLLGHKLSFPKKYPLFDQKFKNHPTNSNFGWKTEKRFFLKTLSKC